MKKNGLFKRYIEAIRDHDRDFTERMFLIVTIITEIAVTIALIGDIYIGENPVEILTVLAVVIMVPACTLTGLYKNRLKPAIKLVVLCQVFGVVPSLFFFGGGLTGGGFLWIIFTFMYMECF